MNAFLKPSTVSDLLASARPILFEDERDEEYPYSIGGSCFLARFHHRHFVITAKHCLHKRVADDLRVEGLEGSGTFLPLQRVHQTKAADTEDNAYADLAIVEMAEGAIAPTELRKFPVLDLTLLRRQRRRLTAGKTELATRGFPLALRGIDYEERRVRNRGFQTDGVYDGPATDQHLHLFRYYDSTAVPDRNGMSGSPVFAFAREGHQLHGWFAGIHVRGGRDNLHGRFIDAEVLLQAFEAILHVAPA